MNLCINKTCVHKTFLLKKNEKNISSIYLLRSKVHVVVQSSVVETDFFCVCVCVCVCDCDMANIILLYLLQSLQHHFSKAEEVPSKLLAHGHCLFSAKHIFSGKLF